ncbi:hypothetical protein FUA48_10595 [Flavobacterium alkalisoli]|uniref:Lipoprotein n=1 Tax=Flavobacterium alkalisoli TaxID=2602769 RepID=A0A5B9FV23_9FLAO|nr:hypothetical protein [Flavobacterium alkalisoli]QEE50011.1 hypothetical protein FUA48_10595 [Flavobacterium alkalisoli]
MKNVYLITLLLLMLISCKKTTEAADSVTETSGEVTEMSIDEMKAAVTSEYGKVVENEADIETDQSAINQVRLIQNGGDGCGSRPGCGKYEYLKNISTDKRIRATVKTTWMYNNEQRSETKVYETDPGQEISLGCTAWCSSMGGRQDFRRSIVGATYLN